MRLLITGATGFIGSSLCRKLASEGNEIICLARNFETSFVQEFQNFQFQHITCDLSNWNNVKNNLKDIKNVDCVFHLAGKTFQKDLLEPQIYFESNFSGTLNILEWCRQNKVKKFVYSSSIAVYGVSANQFNPKYLPIDEAHPVLPYDFYDASKFYSEQLCDYYHKVFGLQCIILRYSRVYGTSLKKGIIFKAIENALKNDQIKVLGDISSDFIIINDVVNANIEAMKKNLNFEIFNIGSGEEVTLRELCSKIIELTKSTSELEYHEFPKARLSLDISKAKKDLDYTPTPLEKGLKECISYIKNSIK